MIPIVDRKKQADYSVYYGGDFFMGEVRKTYDEKFKKKTVDVYLKKGLGYKSVAHEIGIDDSLVRR